MSFALVIICQIMTRNLHVPIQNTVSWDKPVILDKLVFDELLFWSKYLDTLPFRSLAPVFRVTEKFYLQMPVVLQVQRFYLNLRTRYLILCLMKPICKKVQLSESLEL
jgi:hypothetical protein